jgi:hypothetical protein
VYFPASREEFDRLAEELLSAQQVSAPPEHRQNARRFLYYQLFRSSLPFDAFLENEGLRRGYVKLKPFDWRDLLPSHSPTMKTILDGILRHGNFLLEE